jgi:hypothetical protein
MLVHSDAHCEQAVRETALEGLAPQSNSLLVGQNVIVCSYTCRVFAGSAAATPGQNPGAVTTTARARLLKGHSWHRNATTVARVQLFFVSLEYNFVFDLKIRSIKHHV